MSLCTTCPSSGRLFHHKEPRRRGKKREVDVNDVGEQGHRGRGPGGRHAGEDQVGGVPEERSQVHTATGHVFIIQYEF